MVVVTIELDLEGTTEDSQGVVVGVQRPVDDGRDHAFLVVVDQGLLDDAFAGAGERGPPGTGR